MTLAQDASAGSLCRRSAPYDCNEVERRNLNELKGLDFSTTLEMTMYLLTSMGDNRH